MPQHHAGMALTRDLAFMMFELRLWESLHCEPGKLPFYNTDEAYIAEARIPTIVRALRLLVYK
jgi:hypothetical protein